MLIKVDEDLRRATLELLKGKNYEANSVHEQGMNGWKDPMLWEAVQAEGRFLITADKGFGDIRYFKPGTHSGVLLLRPEEDGILPVLRLMKNILETYPLESLIGTVAVATPRGLRIRRSP